MIEIDRHVPNRALKKLTDGEIRKAELITYDIPSDKAEWERKVLSDRELESDRGQISISLSAKEGKRFALKEWMVDVMTGNKHLSEIKEEVGLNPQDRIRVTVDYGGTERTVELGDPRAIRPYVEVPREEVPLNDDNHPEKDKLTSYAFDLLDDLSEEVRTERR